MNKDLLSCADLTHDDFVKLMELSAKIKRERGTPQAAKPLAGKSIGLIFAKASTRTRVSFEIGVQELGGYPIYLESGKTQMGRGETIPDTAKVLERYLHGIVIRTFAQADVEGLAANSKYPVINALTDDYHPCQVLTDMFTMLEYKGKLEGLKMAYLGDGASNMANSLMLACQLAGVDIAIAAPEEYRPNEEIMKRNLGAGKCSWTTDPYEAVKDADFIYTDVWVSMGFEEEAKERIKVLKPYQLDMAKLKAAKPDCKVMHCLPAHRGDEITDEVMDCDQSIVFDEAENRLHVQKAIMTMLMGN
ncbi:MAG: ornithine carbamoyltransferase [Lentisphaeria bacterium]|nr:ornithine carbamoyltransferase [Lentisphaeria bacterium]